MITAIKKIYPVVEELLEKYPASRDNDRLLLVKVWEYQEPYLDSMFSNFAQFKEAFVLGKFANPSSVRRSRSIVQKKRPELRGKEYLKRKTILAEGVRKEINDV